MFVDHLRELAEQRPSRAALVLGEVMLTYGQLMSRVDRSAASLGELGLRPTDVVGLSLADEIEHVVSCLAVMALGAAQITLPTFDSNTTNTALAAAAGVTVILSDGSSDTLPELKSLRWADAGATNRRMVRSGIGRLLLRTSGTTGIGKIVGYDETQLSLQARHVGQHEDQRFLRPASVQHNNGKRHRLYCLFAGGTNVFRPPELDIGAACAKFGVTLVDLSLMHAEDLIRRTTGSQFHTVTIRTGGSAVPFRTRKQLMERVSPHLYVRYGATECATIAMAGPDQHDEDEVAGFPEDGVDVRIVGEDGAPLPHTSAGRICVRTAGMATGYLNAPDESDKRFVDGWFFPGDVGRFRADGSLTVEGRADDMMILNGINVFPQEIERVLQLHPAVKTAAASALRSPVHGEIPVAAVELEAPGSVDVATLMDFARERLGLRAPRKIVILDALPRAAEGKIVRRGIITLIEPMT